MTNSIAILYFVDGLEAKASIHTALDVKDALGQDAFLYPLTKSDWIIRIESLTTDTLCFLATHGELGEDGTLQAYLEANSRPHTHSAATICGTLANKHLTKLVYLSLGVPTPSWIFASNSYGDAPPKHPLKKAKFGGSKMGITKVTDITHDNHNIYEEIITGDLEVSVAVIRDRNSHIPLQPIVRKRSMTHWGELLDLDNSAAPATIQRSCQDYAFKISRSLDCYGVIKTDFVIGKEMEVWAIETDAIPGLSRSNAVSKAAKNTGIKYEELLHKIKETIWKPTN